MATTRAASKTATAKKPAAAGKTTGKTATARKTAAKTTAGKKPATASRTQTTASAAAKKSAPARPGAARRTVASAPTPDERYRMTQEAAYFIAERNGFAGGAMDYWIEAEAQISALLAGK